MSAVIEQFQDSTSLLGDPGALKAHAERDGFLYFKGFLPIAPLLELRRLILLIVAKYGWLRTDHSLMDGVADTEAVARSDNLDPSMRYIGVTRDAYREIQSLEMFHNIPHHHKLLRLYEALFDGPVLPHPRHIARVLLPAPSLTPTPPHQDYVHIQGSHQFWTCWFPLGDCPMELGGLGIMRGSHREGVLDVAQAQGAGGLESILCEKERQYPWVTADFECGDIVTFPSHAVHRGMPNRLGDRIRLSCDLRYQPADQEIESRSLLPHMDVATWEQIYEGWGNRSFQYYWQKNKLQMATWNDELRDPKEKIC